MCTRRLRPARIFAAVVAAALIHVAFASAVASASITYYSGGTGGNVGITSFAGRLWFTEPASGYLGASDTHGNMSQYFVGSGAQPTEIAPGPNSRVWFTDSSAKLGSSDAFGSITEYPLAPGSRPQNLTLGPDGAMWFTYSFPNDIGRMTATGGVTDYPVPSQNASLGQIAAGPDGALWFTEGFAGKIGRITTAGAITEFPLDAGLDPLGIASGPDGAMWFTTAPNPSIGRITTNGQVTMFPIPGGHGASSIVTGPDGALWFAASGDGIGRLTPGGSFWFDPIQQIYGADLAVGPDNAIWFTTKNGIGRLPTDPLVQITSPSSGYVSTSQPTISGTAGTSNGDSTTITVKVYAGAPAQIDSEQPTETTTTTRSGANWSVQLPSALTSEDASGGTYTVVADQTKTNGDDGTSPPVTFAFDDTPPQTVIEKAPGAVSASSTAFFFYARERGTAADGPGDEGFGAATFECKLDGGDWTACTAPQRYSGLAASAHTFSVRATDAAGNLDDQPPSHTWTVDPKPTTIDSGPSGATQATSATFAFHSSESDGSFYCKLDGGPFTVCSSPVTYSGLRDGSHTFTVAAVDAGGTPDPNPPSRGWSVETPPTPSITAAPNPALTGRQVKLDATGSFNDNGGTIVDYRWDFDGSGKFASDTGDTAIVRRTYGNVGVVPVSVRVTNAFGQSSTATVDLDVRLAPPAGPVGVSIDRGALYTNDPDVTLDLVWPPFTQTVTASNDGGFQDAQTFPVDSTIAWTLASTGAERLPKVVYVRFAGGSQPAVETFQDDIILDQRPPTVSSATIVGPVTATAAGDRRRPRPRSRRRRALYTVRVRARDNLSGVIAMEITTAKRHPGLMRPYALRTQVVSNGAPLFVRVRDGAGNWSRWVRVKQPPLRRAKQPRH